MFEAPVNFEILLENSLFTNVTLPLILQTQYYLPVIFPRT